MTDTLAQQTVSPVCLSPAEQALWVEQVRDICRSAPLVRPRTAHTRQAMKVRVTAAGELGWVGDGRYRYERLDSRGRPWPPLPESWRALASRVAGEQKWDSAIINWYDSQASLGWHQDKDEFDVSLPMVTVSLGDACSWAVRMEVGSPISRVNLGSGGITVLEGPTRSAFHTVERIIHEPLFSPLANPGRVSVGIRVAGNPS